MFGWCWDGRLARLIDKIDVLNARVARLGAQLNFIVAAMSAWSKDMSKEVDDLLAKLGEEDTEETGAAVLFDEMMTGSARVLADFEAFKAEIAAAGANKAKLEAAIANVDGDIARHKAQQAAFRAARDAFAAAVATVPDQPAPGPVPPPEEPVPPPEEPSPEAPPA